MSPLAPASPQIQQLTDTLRARRREFGLTQQRLQKAKPDAIVMHPQPMNRGVEIESAVADGPQSRILRQVSNGLAVRMAALAAMLR